ncbi:hypothetical protein QQS21_012000 [Conoideocrella luteorostrata]|uniref:BTB domain-containing protein n=1 Tax=Conoideocrella luteorostrata TaxID=1105319 RepID=A0AAJ0FMT3_9HYPO|nr:hypothetical protein QQS21_012000 [Conoideocrella luteorostrata]
MENINYVVDPEGDVILTLLNPNKPFASWNQGEIFPSTVRPVAAAQNAQTQRGAVQSNPNTSPGNPTPVLQDMTSVEPSEPKQDTQTTQVRYLVSSKALSLGSAYFAKSFRKPLIENLEKKGGHFHITTESWRENTLLTLLRLIHCRGTRATVKSIDALAAFGMLVDYFGCLPVAYVYGSNWTCYVGDQCKGNDMGYNRTTVLYLFCAYYFQDAKLFSELSAALIRKFRGKIPSLGLPLPNKLIEDMNETRERGLDFIAGRIQGMKRTLSLNAPCGTFECTIFRHGVFRKHLIATNIHHKAITACKDGFSVSEILDALRSVSEPRWNIITAMPRKHSGSYRCSLVSTVNELTRDCLDKIQGLDIEYY